ncbi:hypothetical protein ACFVYR_21120 [Streptomyces sp. NPDC058284]|uniref:hypothetical protein n=1 Tax=unclassified Streptomyces TaxID=2593676 RepID=UPI00365F90D2
METPHSGPEAGKPRPGYPPKTTPPPPPQTWLDHSLSIPQRDGRGGRPVMKNRPGTNWSLEAQPWTVGKAFIEVSGRLTKWGFKAPATLEDLLLGSSNGVHVSASQ